MDGKKRFSPETLKEYSLQLLERIGVANEQGEIFVEALIWSDLIGRPTHGVWRLPAYIKRIENGLMKCPCRPSILNDHKATALIDGDEGIGHYVGHMAMEKAIEKAKVHGIGAVGVRNSNHFGTGAYYVNLAAQQNMVGIAVSNSLAKVTPYGGTQAVMGTNPFAFSIPGRDGQGMMFDMATTVMAGSRLMKLAEAGEQLPEGVAVDSQGHSIRDPGKADEGVMLPFGGAKGFGISLMVEILSSVLTGAKFSTEVSSMFTNKTNSGGNGHFFIAIDISQFVPIVEFAERIAHLFRIVRQSGVSPGSVLIPGEIRWHHFRENLSRGIPLDAVTIEVLDSLAEDYRLPGISAEAPVLTAE